MNWAPIGIMLACVRSTSVLVVPVMFILSSCVKEDFDSSRLDKTFDLESGVATPIGYRTLTMNDFFKPDSHRTYRIDENGLLTLFYETSVEPTSIADMVSIPGFSSSGSLVNETGQALDVGNLEDSLLISDTLWPVLSLEPEMDGNKLTQIIFESLNFNIITSSSFNLNASHHLTFPTLTYEDIPYQQPIQANGSHMVKLNEYTLELMEHENDDNTFPVVVETVLYPSNDIVPNQSEILTYEVSFENLNYGIIYGNFTTYAIDLPVEPIDLDIYGSIPDGSFHFSRPELTLLTKSSVGIPVGFAFSKITGLTREEGIQSFEGEETPDQTDPWVFNYPLVGSEYQSAEDSLLISHDQWKFPENSEFAPEELYFDGQVILNPYDNNDEQFITRESLINVDLQMEIPLYGYARFLSMNDTMTFIMNDFIEDDHEEVQRVFFRFYITNAFPVSINFQVYIANETYSVIDSLFTERQIIDAANQINTVTEPIKNDPIIVEIDRDKLNLLKEHGIYLISNGHIQTNGFTQQPPLEVGIYDDQFIDINIGLVLDVNQTIDDF